jgi:hypothetical protein
MGKDFISIKANRFNIESVFNRIKHFKVIEASAMGYFNIFPKMYEVMDIEIGTDNTTESIIRLNNGDYVVVEGVVSVSDIKTLMGD